MYRLLPICSTLTKTVTVLVIFYRTLTNAEFYKDYKRIKRKKCSEKGATIFCLYFAKYRLILKILSPTDLAVNL